MARKRSTIVLVIIGVAICLFVVAAGTAAWVYFSMIDAVDSDEVSATRSLDEARARFKGQEPIIAIRDDKQPILVRAVPAVASPRDLQNVQILAWNAEEARLTTVTLPFWLVRMRSSVPIMANGEEISLSADEIERYGPALFLDHSEEDGSRALVWTE